MHLMRRLFRDRPAVAALLLALVLCLKAVMPAGFMPQVQGAGIVVALCSSAAPDGAAKLIRIGEKPGHAHPQDAADHPCAFSPLGSAMLGSVPLDIALAALLFVFAATILQRPQVLHSSGAQIRPPLRGPPPVA